MAEAGPSSPSPRPSSLPAAPPPQRATRIQFPVDHPRSHVGDSSSLGSFQSLGLGPPPALRKSGIQGGSISFQQDDKRRRVKSVDASSPFEPSRSRDGYADTSINRSGSFSRKGEQRELLSKAVSNALLEPFSDEYDLSREDPGVLEDVQRALRAKARREARLRTQSTPLRVEPPRQPDRASISSAGSSHDKAASAVPPSPRQPRVSEDSEIDFSPAVGVVPSHPVPSSLDGGVTLDWSTSGSEHGRERRWSLSRGKRRSKDLSSIPLSRAATEKQDAAYIRKLEQIRAKVKPTTLKKVDMITKQLERKYQWLACDTASPPVNLLSVVRWYRSQPADLRAALDEAEPATWMKHLWDRPEHHPPLTGSSSWSPTAFVVREYVQTHPSPHSMETIPENEVVLPSSPNAASSSDARSPTLSSYSWTTPRHSIDAAISRKRSSHDVLLSFEPMVESGRDSLGPDSRHSSDNYRSWKHAGPDSARSSVYSIVSRGASPNSSRRRLRNIGKRLKTRHSDEALSSARNSISEYSGHSASEDGGPVGHQKIATLRPRSRPTSLHLQGSSLPEDSTDSRPSASGTIHPFPPEAPTTATQSTTLFPGTPEPTPRPQGSADAAATRITLPLRRFRRSLPSSTDIFARERAKHRRSADEQKEREEYDIKAQVLEDTSSQNYRIRHLLQRVCANIREYESVQAGLSNLLGVSYTKIPSEVLDTFIHDPSAVTGGTRRTTSWRAVEDIHERIERQRQTLQTFIHSQLSDGELDVPSSQVFDDPIAQLMAALEQLAAQRQELAAKAEEVSSSLKQVKTIHADVKKVYHDTLAHTSLVYPELSQIAALEENYRNQFQQFWDIGLDALTFLLDTVTPFWRNYGKVIGEDVQDFLIIPWYRNEFTGEPKRYPIKHFPQRSYRHWAGLVFLSACSVVVGWLQFGAAWALTTQINMPWISHTGLRWIAFPIYTILLLIQWCAVILEAAIVVAQCGIIVWWMGWSIKLWT
ncbi:hypothetical protein K466DRAFT_509605 [Polyporus arcularius HHB13444]|uniref:Uncharacterized protein n=1 Tax=Polyporus arcularius HHB13444 TaxID=1314778 RepID=A0A5C3PXY0_9APHY|nr:hypothetical protein K466DRAFT_509605 [Polyporus arcularius HHB13444]